MSDQGDKNAAAPVTAPATVLRSQGGADPTATGGVSRAEGGGNATIVDKSGQGRPVLDKDGKPIVKEGDLPVDPNVTPAAVDPNTPPAKVYTPEEQAAIADPKMGKFSKEFIDTGNLSDASVKEAAALFGVPEDVVKTYVQGRQALQNNQGNTVAPTAEELQAQQTNAKIAYEFSKDDAGWQNFGAWATQHLTEQERGAIENAVMNGYKDPVTARAVIGQFYGRFQASGGSGGPRDVTTQGQSGTGTFQQGGFNSKQEMVKAMQDPRYNVDPAYTNEVVKKVELSTFG